MLLAVEIFFFFQTRKPPLGYLVKLKYVIYQLSHLKGEKKGRSRGDGDLMLSLKSRSLKKKMQIVIV